MSTAELRYWLRAPDLMKFPYGAVVREYHGVGKHFVRREVLELLADVRTRLPDLSGPWPHMFTLASFLSTALDKPDDRYDYPTYLALPLLQLPGPDDPVEQAPFQRSRCDRLMVQLVCDALAFELAAADGRTAFLPDMRPAPGLVGKRYKHGLRVITPALARMSLGGAVIARDLVERVRQACAVVHADMSFAERQVMRLSILPVYTLHDEYLFLRVLQTFETTFALLAAQLRGVLAALAERDVDRAVYLLDGSEIALRDSAPLFAVLATMQVAAFRSFRQFTEGASAIQSRNYKMVESLCRTPDPDRCDSAAYLSVPEVRARVLVGQHSLDDAYRELYASDDVGDADRKRLGEAMLAFSGTLRRWRHTHYRLAVRMLGQASGTGYTEGTPYLDAVRRIPVFRTLETEETTLEERAS